MRFDRRRAHAFFAAFTLALVVVAMGYRYVWQQLPHALPADKLAVDAGSAGSIAAQCVLLLDMAGEGKLTDTYVRTMFDDATEDLRDAIAYSDHMSPARGSERAFALYRQWLAREESVTSGLASPAVHATNPAIARPARDELDRLAHALSALSDSL